MRPGLPLRLALLSILAARAWPQSTAVLASDRDTTLYFDQVLALGNGAGQHLFCGTNGSGFLRRGLLHFDVGGALPAGSQVVSARVVLSLSKTEALSSQVQLYRVLADWGEGASDAPAEEGGGAPAQPGDATWMHTFFPASLWAVAGGDLDPAPSAVASAGAVPGTVSFLSAGLAADVQGWLDGTLANHGWALRGNELASMTAKRFDTREHPNPAVRPRLEVVYLVPAAVVEVGSGCATSAGTPLVAAAIGLPVVPNPSFAVAVSGGPPGRTALLFLASDVGARVPFGGPGCAVALDFASAVAFVQAGVSPAAATPLDAAGAGLLMLPVPAQPSLVGTPLAAQVLVIDLSLPGQLALSNALDMLLGV